MLKDWKQATSISVLIVFNTIRCICPVIYLKFSQRSEGLYAVVIIDMNAMDIFSF